MTLSRDGLKRATALSLAEAGFDDATVRIRTSDGYSMASKTLTTFPTETLYEDFPSKTKTSGTFVASVAYVDSTTRRVTSVGTSRDGKSVTVTGIVRVIQEKLGKDNAQAIKAAGNVKLAGNGSITTIPANSHNANVQSNGDVDMGGSNTTVDGTIQATGSIDGIDPKNVIATVKATEPFSFVDGTTQKEWKDGWEAQAKAGSSRGGVTSAMTLTGPMFINGDINLSKTTLTLRGGGKSVIFVNGNVKLGTQSTLDSNVTLVVTGTFDMTAHATYKVTRPTLPLKAGEAEPALLVYNTGGASEAISITGGSSSNQQGIVYAMKGDIKIAGNSVFTGALYNADPNGLVKSTGGFTHYFPLFGESIIDEAGSVSATFVTEQ